MPTGERSPVSTITPPPREAEVMLAGERLLLLQRQCAQRLGRCNLRHSGVSFFTPLNNVRYINTSGSLDLP